MENGSCESCPTGLIWYGNMVRMDEERQTKKVWRAQVAGGRRRGPNLRWMDGVSRALEV